MGKIINASINFFNSENEVDALVDIYDRVYKLSLKFEDLSIVFINLNGNPDTPTIHDLNKTIYYNNYSEYNDYTLDELEDQICLIYREFYKQGKDYNTVVFIIHDSTEMSDCIDIESLKEYLEERLNLLDVLRMYVFCTVRDE